MSYVIRNCPACKISPNCCTKYYLDSGHAKDCQDVPDCIMKQIVEKCKKEIRVYRNTLLPNDGTNTLHFGRQSFAYDILRLLDVQEIE